MADGMSFDKYIDNPSGGASVVTNRNMYKNMYKSKFNAVLVREQGKIDFEVFKTKDKNDTYYIYMKIPSEVIPNFYYDVVIKLYTTVNAKKASSYLRHYAVGFYSNDPAFVYTFAYSFAKNNLFIDDLEPKMSKKALRDKAKVRNPKNEVWYVKSLYFAYLAMEKYNLFHRINLDRVAKRYSKRELLSKITHADKKIQDRISEQEKLKKEKKAESRNPEERNVHNATARTKTSNITKTAKTSTVSKRSNTTKTTKKI